MDGGERFVVVVGVVVVVERLIGIGIRVVPSSS